MHHILVVICFLTYRIHRRDSNRNSLHACGVSAYIMHGRSTEEQTQLTSRRSDNVHCVHDVYGTRQTLHCALLHSSRGLYKGLCQEKVKQRHLIGKVEKLMY